MVKKLKEYHNKLRDYVYNPTVNLKDRTFILFSVAVLFALFIAVPCGLIMREPLSATISTLIGAIIFSIYVYLCFKFKRLARARIAISIILVFIFLPLMFFTNGGIYGGTPVWLLLGTLYISFILEGKIRVIMLIINFITMGVYWIIGFRFPDLITEYSRGGNYFDTLAAIIIVSMILYTMISFQLNLSRNDEKENNLRRLFEQTATALVNAIDAKDKYTHGHSSRVAEYSRMIAERAGKSPRECDDIYYVALLHDVGKIGIPEAIINKEGKLTNEEYEVIKKHSTLGAQILQSISEIPYLSLGANFHHERYDGKGYPSNLKGTDIPEYARIVSVADAYDAMTSRRSYRDPIPQQQVREELVKGSGTQFDPDFARIMIHLLDIDSEYDMKERDEVKELAGKNELMIGRHRENISDGIHLTPNMTIISMRVTPDKNIPGRAAIPSLVLFDSLDGRYHDDERNVKELLYFEYGEIWFDGHTQTEGARLIQTRKIKTDPQNAPAYTEYRIEALRIKDHALIKITGHDETYENIIALPDSVRYSYIGLTGECCHITNVKIDREDEAKPDDFIPRIAEEISFINVPEGDIPNVQINDYRAGHSAGIPVTDGMQITFHTMSLPTARLVWHCPYINIFTSDDGAVYGPNYHDYVLMRVDGECWEGDDASKVIPLINKNDDFDGWDSWKEFNHKGYDCTVSFELKDNSVIIRTENHGISLKNTAIIKKDDSQIIYAALTGDQVALTNIRIKK